MSDISTLLQPLKDRLAAATPGPWREADCHPCGERGRMEVNVWDEAGNVLITNWCDDDPFHRPDATFIAAAPTDQAKLIAAVEAVDRVCADWAKLADGDKYYAAKIRAALTQALGGDTA